MSAMKKIQLFLVGVLQGIIDSSGNPSETRVAMRKK